MTFFILGGIVGFLTALCVVAVAFAWGGKDVAAFDESMPHR